MNHVNLSIIAIITVEHLHISHPLYISQYRIEIQINVTKIPRRAELVHIYLRFTFPNKFYNKIPDRIESSIRCMHRNYEIRME